MPEDRKKRSVHKPKGQKMTVSQKIRLLIREGKSQEQAVAIAKSMERRGELRKG